MKLSVLALFAFAALVAAKGRVTYLVTFPDETPQHEVDKAASEVEGRGGVINHRYTLIKGFSVISDEDSMNILRASGNEKYPPTVEEDQVVYALGPDH
ncbi:hypothetical protein DFH27DRAFT_611367 [Peziza echinospora]|nr:hypothetical protein DFH27DRAFT_611367 [Peziza echinospora]